MSYRPATSAFRRHLGLALLFLWVLSSCSSESQSPGNDSQVSFKVPERIRTSQAIDQSQVMATVSANNQEVKLTRTGDSFNGAITIGSGTELSFVLQVIEQVGAQQIVLATLSNTQLITNDTTITLRANQYTYPDNDSDGYNNLTEREAGSDYANSNSTPLNITGETGVEPTLNPGVLQYSAQDYTASEADGTLTLTVTRLGGSDGRVTVRYMLNNETALSGQDFQAASGELIWEDGDSSPKTFEATLLADDDFEGEQTFTVHLFSATGGSAIGNGFSRVTLTDSTPAPQRGTLQLTTNRLQFTEADGTALISIERVGGSDGLVTVDYNTVDGTATTPEDYTGITNPRTLAWADGDATPKNISIQLSSDTAIESAESFELILTSVRGGAVLGTAAATISIADSTEPVPVTLNGTASIEDSTYNVTEGTTIDIPVKRLNGSDGAVSVSYTLISGTALASTDYAPASGTISWADQDSTTKVITLSTIADTALEGPEKFTLSLSNASGGITIDAASAEITIVDSITLSPGTIAFTDEQVTVNEGDSATVSISRTGGSDEALSAIVSATPASSTEFSLSNNTLIWAAGESGIKTITIEASSDTVIGDTETVTLSLAVSASSTAQPVIGNGTLTFTITDSSPSGFTPFVDSDGEWEVCISPYQTTTTTAFSNQLSATSGSIVTCIKQCPADAVIDTAFTGWGWNAAAQHSCLFTTASEGTITKAPVYTPQREAFTLNLSADTFAAPDSVWLCTRENRINAEFSYVRDSTANTWYQILSDGTYYYADSTDSTTLPETLNGPEIWSVAGRFLSFGHIGEIYRNVFIFPGEQTFQVHPDSDHRLNCQRISTATSN